MITGIAHVCLSARDLSASERFYCQGLGLKKAFDFIRHGEVIGFYLEVARGSFIEIFRRDITDPKAKGPIDHFCLEVDDIDQIGQRLNQHGYETTVKHLGADHSWQLWTTDPDGVRIEFHLYTPDSCQRTRENCVFNS